MVHALTSRPDALERLTSFSASNLVAGMQKLTGAVMAQGAVLITRLDEPTMALMSVDHYLKLEQAAEPNLDVLTRRFDDMFAQGCEPRAGA